MAFPPEQGAGRRSEDEDNDNDPRSDQEGLLTGEHGISTTEPPANTHKTVRKLDTILLPFLALLFLLNSLDKSNIGNAETAGFTADTGLSRSDINTSMGAFFAVFVLLQPVGAALGRRVGMARYVPVCMSLWGLTTLLHMFVRRQWQLVALRVTIAALESGFYPTTVSYLSLFYTKYEFGVRVGCFYGMTAVSGVLGGVLGWALFSHFPNDGAGGGSGGGLPPPRRDGFVAAIGHGWRSWEVLFLIEGCMTMTVALIGFLWLPKSADTAWFLTAPERSWAEERIRRDKGEQQNLTRESHRHTSSRLPGRDGEDANEEAQEHLLGSMGTHADKDHIVEGSTPATADSGLDRQDVLSAIFNYKIWHLLIVNILSAIPATAFGVLLPILVKELSPSLSLSPASSNLLSAPPFACGAIVLFMFTFWSDRTRQRLVPILWGLGLLLLGLLMTVVAPMDNYWLRYVSLCILLAGSFVASPLTVAWLANNTPQPGKRAILLGINGWGNLAGCFIVVLFTPDDRKDGYVRSFVVLLVCVVGAFAGFIAFWVLLVRENRWRESVVRKWSGEERERELSHGDVQIPDTLGAEFARLIGIDRLTKWLGLEPERRGDNKLTFQYSL